MWLPTYVPNEPFYGYCQAEVTFTIYLPIDTIIFCCPTFCMEKINCCEKIYNLRSVKVKTFLIIYEVHILCSFKLIL